MADELPAGESPLGIIDAAQHGDRRQLGRLVFHSICSAACAIVPVPFLDEHLVKLTRRRMTDDLASAHSLVLGKPEVMVLSGTQSAEIGWGCFVGLALTVTFKIAVKIIRRIFRTVLFWLLIKDAADAASRTFHEGYLISKALDRRSSDSLTGSTDADASTVEALRGPIDGVLARVNTKALTHAFKGVFSGSKTLLLKLARTLSRLTGLAAEPDEGEATLERELESSIPKSLVELVVVRVLQQGEYLRHLDELLAEEFFKSRATPMPTSSVSRDGGPADSGQPGVE